MSDGPGPDQERPAQPREVQPEGVGPTTGAPRSPESVPAGDTAPRVTPVSPKKAATIWIVAGVVIVLLLLCVCLAISALVVLVPSDSTVHGNVGGGTSDPGSSYVEPDDDFDALLITGAESVAVGCVLYYQDTGQKPAVDGIEATLEPYVVPWPTNPFTERPLRCGGEGVGCLEVASLDPGLGPSSVEVVRVLLSTGEWYEVEVPYQ